MADYYKTLGVDRKATDDEIKKAYRKLALKHHPDRNKGDKKAEEQFKKISEAYAVLSEPDKRREYDQVGDAGFHQRFSQEDIFRGADFGKIFREADLGDMGGIFGRIFGGGMGSGPRGGFGGGGFDPFEGRGGRVQYQEPPKGQDVEYTLTVGFHEAFHGGERALSLTMPDGSRFEQTVRIPAGVRDGGRLRLAGKGIASPHGGAPGDLVINIKVASHPTLTRDGDDLEGPVHLRMSDLALGAQKDVETMDGVKKVKIPAGVKPGTKVRLKGLGFPMPGKKDARGDFYAVVEVEVPKHPTSEQREVLERLREVGL